MIYSLILAVLVAGAPEKNRCDHACRVKTAKQLSECVGVIQFAAQREGAIGKPGSHDVLLQVAHGTHAAALWVYETDWRAENPGKDPPTYGTFSPRVENVAELKRTELAARAENGDWDSATKALASCRKLNPLVEAANAQLRKEVPAIKDLDD